MKPSSILICGLLLSPTTATAAQEAPDQGLQAIIADYRAGDFDGLIRERYAEFYKAKFEADVEKLIARFQRRFADAGKLAQAIARCEKALNGELRIETNEHPLPSETGEIAPFPLGQGDLRRYRMKNGKWGFPL